MINGNPHDFIDTVYSGQEIFFFFNGKKFMFQGYMERDICYMEIQQHFPWNPNEIWFAKGDSMLSCLDQFLDAPIFNQKTFWEVESEIEWVDD